MMNQRKVTCRPCKEENNWEIQDPNGTVLEKHYTSKTECVHAGQKLATEFSCELIVEDETESYE